MPRIEISTLNTVMQKYARQLDELGTGKAKTVLSRALTYEGRKAFTRVKRDLKTQGSFTSGMMAGVKFKPSSRATLETRIVGPGKELNVAKFGARQFSYGVRAKVWGKNIQFRHSFAVPAWGGNVMARTTSKRFPLKGIYGPSIAKEIVKDQAPTGYYQSIPLIQERVAKEIAAVLRGF